MILAKAINSVGDDTEKVSHFIATLTNYEGASGDISFDARREVVKPVSIKTVKGGRFMDYSEIAHK
jgi:ABC-type branched-subunit amino acid transport system substrate-binding protein